MQENRYSRKAVILNPFLLIFGFLALVLSIFLFNRKKIELLFKIEFSAKIIEIKKQYRDRFDIKLQVKDKIFQIQDHNFSSYRDKINIGDSLIKPGSTDCFYYKRHDTIIVKNCTTAIREIQDL